MAQDAYLNSEKTVEVELHVPFRTNDGVVQGKVKLPASVAEDLMRRQHEYDQDQRKLMNNNGENIDALGSETIKG